MKRRTRGTGVGIVFHKELYDSALRELQWKGIIHGSRIQDIALEIGTRPEHAENVMDALVKNRVAKWDHPAPTHSQVAFRSMTYGGVGKGFKDALQNRSPDFKTCWYLTSTKRAKCLDAPPEPLDWCEIGDHMRDPDSPIYCRGCHG